MCIEVVGFDSLRKWYSIVHTSKFYGTMTSKAEKTRRMDIRRRSGNRRPPEPRVPTPRVEYLVSHACFDCRKSFKIAPRDEGAVCPQCAGQLHEMGRSFKAPKVGDTEQWQKVEKLWRAGFRFFSYRSHPGAEPLPERLRDVDDFMARNPDHPFRVADPGCAEH
jgi:DNA-directed RNA polymerase subunit RPC12/RpoP